MIYGYARVSTIEQDTRMQIDALRNAGATVIYSEKTSSVGQRPELQKLLVQIGKGDKLYVYKVDRVARSLKDLMLILEVLEHKEAKFQSLTEPIQTDSYLGKFMMQILGAVAELERNLIRERSIAGQVAAYRRGVKIGGRAKLLPDDVHEEMKKAREQHGLTWAELGRRYGVSNTTARRYVLGDNRDRMKVLRQYIFDFDEPK